MRQFGCLKAIAMSFYSKALYRDVVQNWTGGVLLYILLLITICWSFNMVPMQIAINQGYKSFSTKYLPQMPEMLFKDGQLTTPENRPYFIKDFETKNTILVIDTSGEYTNLDKLPNAGLVTKNAVIYKDKNEIKTKEFPAKFNLDIKPEVVQQKLASVIDWAWVLFLPCFIFFSFCYQIIKAIFYALFGKIFTVFANIPLTYGEIFKMTFFAMTPALIINTVSTWFSFTIPHDILLSFLITLTYLAFGILANKST